MLYATTEGGSDSVLNPVRGGLAVPSPLTPFDADDSAALFGSGHCPRHGQAARATNTSLSVLFGRDLSTGCSLRLTRSQLRTLCCTGSPHCATSNSSSGGGGEESSPYTTSDGLPLFLAQSLFRGSSLHSLLFPSLPPLHLPHLTRRIGIYGSADPLDATQWLSLTLTSPADPVRQWSERTSTCLNAYSGLQLRLLVAATGEKANPQHKIVAALAEVVVADWTTRSPLSCAASSSLSPSPLSPLSQCGAPRHLQFAGLSARRRGVLRLPSQSRGARLFPAATSCAV